MNARTPTLFVLAFALIPVVSAQADDAPATYERAKALAKEKKWTEAETVAREATGKDPKNVKAWYLLGVIENRLEKEEETLDAYAKVYDLDRDGLLGQAVAPRVIAEDERIKHKYGPESSGIFFSYSPVFKTKIASDLGSSLSKAFAGGFRISIFDLGFKSGSGSVQSIQGNTHVSSVGPVSHSFYEFFFELPIPVVKPYTSLGGLGVSIPFFFGFEQNNVTTTVRTYGTMAGDFASGLQLALFTKSAFLLSVDGLYHVSVPVWEWRADGVSKPIRNSSGNLISTSAAGPEVKIQLTLLFGA